MQPEASDWQMGYLYQLRSLLDAEREEAERLWQRTRWLRLLTLPMWPAWMGLRASIDHSEEVWQAMWTLKTNPAHATARQRMLAYWSMPRTRQLAYAQLYWTRAILKNIVWLSIAVSLCVYFIVGLIIVRLLGTV